MKQISKIIVHDRFFHADDVFSVALVEVILNKELEVIRTSDFTVLKKASEEEGTIIADVGGKYDSSRLLFDHHQDTKLPAAIMLVAGWLVNEGALKQEIYKGLYPILNGISKWDTDAGGIHRKYKPLYNEGIRNVSEIIRAFNRAADNDVQFAKAVLFAKAILRNELHRIENFLRDAALADKRNELPNGVVVFKHSINNWWAFTSKYAVMPCSDNENCWIVLRKFDRKTKFQKSRSTKLVYGNDRFMKFIDRASAVAYARRLR